MSTQHIVEPPERPARSTAGKRSVGRWYIGDSLGQGGYSWVKKGHDKRTGKVVALKFMSKADSTWAVEQKRQVMSEIESLTSIKHPNVLRLYAYNLDTRYPERNGTKTQVILLVLEYAEGGELFDVLYYTSHLACDLARTYFAQLIDGLTACHAANIAHRDIKPQNLLLDSHFNLKIADFGLSKLVGRIARDSGSESDDSTSNDETSDDADQLMYTTYVGTAGYQAPELLLRQPFGMGCDIFSAGVVLFVLLNGYPPFNEATKSDRWYKHFVNNRPSRFWERHHNSPIVRSNNLDAIDLLSRMFAFNPSERITLDEIREHSFYMGRKLRGRELVAALRTRHREAQVAKLAAQGSVVVERQAIAKPVRGDNAESDIRERLPLKTGVDCVHLTDMISSKPYEEVYEFIRHVLVEWSQAHVDFVDDESPVLFVTMRVCNDSDLSKHYVVKFYVSFHERDVDGRTIIRVKRAFGDVFRFNEVREKLEMQWRSVLDM